jgi:S-adenosyl methyltransferase
MVCNITGLKTAGCLAIAQGSTNTPTSFSVGEARRLNAAMVCNLSYAAISRKIAVLYRVVCRDPFVPSGAGTPSIARGYHYALGAKDYCVAGHGLATGAPELAPLSGVLAGENRPFLARAVGYVTRQGIGPFIDVGPSRPARPRTRRQAGPARTSGWCT